ncbi:hypothetical protein PsorP6_009110 [Peronosclerospora sorghi]|uniref:Uncharacterized protein n=1 Tax=Peronosclerospora sorghi TaxID=230839 RepID=A0ACC0W0L2_9STRA|nr:hypothetical protein PsorP6_009110 [Peronosclerospora sorghi]
MNVRRALEKLRLPTGLQPERIQWLYEGARAPAETGYLLYWMQTSVRAHYNYALEYAIAAANALHLPLHVIYLLPDRSVVPTLASIHENEWKAEAMQDANAHAFGTARHARFALEGLVDVHARLARRGMSFDVFHHQHQCLARHELLERCARNAAVVVTDRPYLRPWRTALDKLVSSAKEREEKEDSSSTVFGVVQVEGDVVVPVALVSDKEEFAARTIRSKIHKHLERFIVPLESLTLEPASQTETRSLFAVLDRPQQLKPLDVTSATAVSTTLELLDVDSSVKSVEWLFHGGEAAASACMEKFLTPDKMAKYATERNEPSLDAGSNLSLYLHYGHISVVCIVLAASKLKGVTRAKEGLASFLEELIVRRELSVNLVVYNQDNYDSMRCLPNYAQITLKEHALDKRERIYSREKLELFQTGDRYWNAAQRELVVTGKMHGYMRMYWAKKLLEWTRTPEEGFDAALVLNNKYALDAPDPNSYAGVAWSFGKHDQGWKERPIFGKVRYMNESGLKRKFKMDAYVLKVGRLAAQAKKVPGLEKLTVDEEKAEPAERGRVRIGATRPAEKGAAGPMKKTKLEPM